MKTAQNFWLNDQGECLPEVKVGMVIDEYKLPDLDKWWDKGVGHFPKCFNDIYVLDREEIKPGPFPKTRSVFRYYKLKENLC